MSSKFLEMLREKKKLIAEYAFYLFVLVFILYLAPTFLMEKIVVDGTSMQQTLQDGDHVLIEKVSRYFEGPERFDIIVFTKKAAKKEKVYIKRIIGMPGDKIQIVGDVIFINDQAIPENYGSDSMLYAGIAAEPLILAEDEYFVLGDNRNNSSDSRTDMVGSIKRKDIIGKAWVRVWPLSDFEVIAHQ